MSQSCSNWSRVTAGAAGPGMSALSGRQTRTHASAPINSVDGRPNMSFAIISTFPLVHHANQVRTSPNILYNEPPSIVTNRELEHISVYGRSTAIRLKSGYLPRQTIPPSLRGKRATTRSVFRACPSSLPLQAWNFLLLTPSCQPTQPNATTTPCRGVIRHHVVRGPAWFSPANPTRLFTPSHHTPELDYNGIEVNLALPWAATLLRLTRSRRRGSSLYRSPYRSSATSQTLVQRGPSGTSFEYLWKGNVFIFWQI